MSSENPIEQRQLAMPLDPSLDQLVADVKNRLQRQQEELDLQPFWQYFSSIMAMVSSVGTAIMMIVVLVALYLDPAPDFPLFHDAIEGTWIRVDKLLYLVVFGGFIVIKLSLLFLIRPLFLFDKRLARMIGWINVLMDALLVMAILQIGSL